MKFYENSMSCSCFLFEPLLLPTNMSLHFNMSQNVFLFQKMVPKVPIKKQIWFQRSYLPLSHYLEWQEEDSVNCLFLKNNKLFERGVGCPG